MADSFEATLRTAIRARGLSLERLHARLAARGIRVSLASLSNWQSGRCRPERSDSLRALHALEEILEVPDGMLLTLLGPPRPRGRWTRRAPGELTFREICVVHGSVDRLLGEIRNPRDGQLRWLGCHERVVIGPQREERSVHTRLVLQALADGVDRHVAVYHGEHGLLPDIRKTTYCRPGRQRTDLDEGVVAVELLFERPLREHETCVLEYEFGYSDAVLAPYNAFWYRWFRYPAHEYLLQVQFAPGALPTRCHQVWQPNLTASPTELDTRLDAWHTAHLAQVDVRPGILGLRWDWD
ncbi:hypothetical protein [Spirillospora sp. CA-294931]|uniref:hypothetical protein n=1 Tax=Spirillospora sp. CA-294931 TaxID=3240042 RepID=UPI003D8FB05B